MSKKFQEFKEELIKHVDKYSDEVLSSKLLVEINIEVMFFLKSYEQYEKRFKSGKEIFKVIKMVNEL